MTHRHRGKSSERYIDKAITLRALSILPGQVIVDAGCGNGYMSKAFSRALNHTGRIYALDPDREAIKILKKETIGTNIEAIVADITQATPIETSSVDLIYLSTVVHGFTKDQLENLQQEIKRLLKPNARLAIVEIQKRDTPFGPPLDRRFSPEELRQIIHLKPKRVVEVGAYLYMQIFEHEVSSRPTEYSP